MGVIALVSGGIDSTVMCKIIENEGETVIPLYINYGQLATEMEWSACKELYELCKLPSPNKLDIPGYGKFIHSGLTDESKNIEKDAFLPGRNLLFLLVGAAYAFSLGQEKVAIGLLSEKTHIFGDQTEGFIVNTNFALNSALEKNMILLTPLINFTKSDTVKLAKHYLIPLDKTYSCHSGKAKYCGHCISCKEIIDSGNKDDFPQFERSDDSGR